MNHKFSLAELEEWHQNHVDNHALPAITERAFIDIEDLDDLVKEMKDTGAKSVIVYFIRCKVKGKRPQKNTKVVDGVEAPGCEWLDAGGGISQISIAIRPVKDIKIDLTKYLWEVEELPGDPVTLVMPGRREEGPSGLNPPPKQDKIGG